MAALAKPHTVAVSVAGGVCGNGESNEPSMSADGRFVAFASHASNLVAADTNGCRDVFLRDLVLGSTKIVSLSSDGTQGNGDSWAPSLSGDGRFVAFASMATNLVPGDTNGLTDVFVRDLQAGVTQRVSISSSAAQANGRSDWCSISSGGKRVAFASLASNLCPDDVNGTWDIFVRDIHSGSTSCVSLSLAGVPGNGRSYTPSITASGDAVTFESAASDLVPGDTNNCNDNDAFVRDLVTGLTTRVSVSSSGAQANGYSDEPFISPDGRWVAFHSSANNLVPGDSNGVVDAFLHDRSTGTITCISKAMGGGLSNSHSWVPVVTPGGRWVAFRSDASNLVSGDSNNFWDTFVRDMQTGVTWRVSVAEDGAQGNGGCVNPPSISADGRYVAFTCAASNLVPGDDNGVNDVFVRGPLFDVATAPYTIEESRFALGTAAGLAVAAPYMPRLDVASYGVSTGRIDLLDAVRIARKVAGLEPNP
jgi:Tol biopolymer transport system component